MDEAILNKALENLRENAGIEGLFAPHHTGAGDGYVDFNFANGKERFLVAVKREIRYHQLEPIIQWAKSNKHFMVIAQSIFPKIKAELRAEGIGYLDAAGNIFLQTDNRHVWIEGHKVEKVINEKVNRAFTATGLKVVFRFLMDAQFVNQPQRIIAQETGVALGNINYILKGLRSRGYLIAKNDKESMLINRKALLNEWVVGFEEKLKPNLHIGNFRLLKNEEYAHWTQIPLKKHQSFWGGEAAGALITKHLLPGIFTIYTEENRQNLSKDYKLVPDTSGNIKVYKKFWKGQMTYNETVVHPILVYADLIHTGERRSLETAQKLYDALLHNGF